MWEEVKKRWLYMQGPAYDIGDRVIIAGGEYLRLPRKIKTIGWNNKNGHFFYALEGIKDQLFLDSHLIDYAYASNKIIVFKPSTLEQKLLNHEAK